jgi:hypothetical protein
MYHRPTDADPGLDFARCRCDSESDPSASVAIDEFGYFSVRQHADDFYRLAALAQLGGQRCLCLQARELYVDRSECRPRGRYVPREWQDSRCFLPGLRLRRRLPKFDSELIHHGGTALDWLANALKARGWLTEIVKAKYGDPVMKAWCWSTNRPIVAICSVTSHTTLDLICRVTSRADNFLVKGYFLVNGRCRGQLFVGVEAILLAHGFDRRVGPRDMIPEASKNLLD